VMPACRARQGRHRHHRQLDASVGASGPHDYKNTESEPAEINKPL
jgi:hypothetical protein